jgi:hypothetical protein
MFLLREDRHLTKKWKREKGDRGKRNYERGKGRRRKENRRRWNNEERLRRRKGNMGRKGKCSGEKGEG